MTTVRQVIDLARWDWLNNGPEEAMNQLTGSLDASTTSLTMLYEPDGIARGSRLSIDLEDFYVWDVNATSKEVTVTRGHRGSVPAAHAAGATVFVNTRPTDAQLFRAVNQELNALSPTLFRVKTATFTFNPVVTGYDLAATDLLSVYRVRYSAIGPEMEWPVVDHAEWELGRNMGSGDFADTTALFIHGAVDPGRSVRVEYKASFDQVTTVTDDILTVTGLHSEAHDILSIGAAMRLLAGREVQRVRDDTQGSTRRANEVPAGSNTGAFRTLSAIYQQRVNQEAGRLQRLYPERTRG